MCSPPLITWTSQNGGAWLRHHQLPSNYHPRRRAGHPHAQDAGYEQPLAPRPVYQPGAAPGGPQHGLHQPHGNGYPNGRAAYPPNMPHNPMPGYNGAGPAQAARGAAQFPMAGLGADPMAGPGANYMPGAGAGHMPGPGAGYMPGQGGHPMAGPGANPMMGAGANPMMGPGAHYMGGQGPGLDPDLVPFPQMGGYDDIDDDDLDFDPRNMVIPEWIAGGVLLQAGNGGYDFIPPGRRVEGAPEGVPGGVWVQAPDGGFDFVPALPFGRSFGRGMHG
ncbi:uncharacterized protein K452DRAFT_332659 [Aplosporella prunicola CBS 121167]|uniref:Uncharacterized protein n=1 Tax=Aplosporella prunicola CBS 121167 TaxID=1176127 RepID=A0A6A6BHC7_9PEZI|nr:uncharacterized protein K452DRAFT_332659 [Aplosporella prunicola CBS 121167]KAF2141941.1 hypothetical protein K452DRAFT_332659 [Aplosporella prunicola CBS 121167]